MKKWKIALLILLIFGIGISVYVYNSMKYNSQMKESQMKEKIAWDKAQKKNTISAYEEFLEKYPKSKFAHESRSRIESLKKERHPWFRDVKKAKIIIEKKFHVNGKFKHVSINTLPIIWWLEEFVGINVINNKDENSDMIVRVKVSGQIRGAWYGSFGNKEQFAYTGGAINGTISFEVGSNKIEEGFRGEKELESVIRKGSWKDPEDALSSIMESSSFNEKIAILVYKAFGLTPLISAVKSGRYSGDAAEALGKLKDPRAVEPLIEALKDENPDVRASAEKALEKINPKWRETEEAKKWVPVFISDLKSKSLGTREAAVYALGKLKDPRAVEPLIEALKDKEPEVPPNADYALREITGQDFGIDPEKWQKWWGENKGRFIKGK